MSNRMTRSISFYSSIFELSINLDFNSFLYAVFLYIYIYIYISTFVGFILAFWLLIHALNTGLYCTIQSLRLEHSSNNTQYIIFLQPLSDLISKTDVEFVMLLPFISCIYIKSDKCCSCCHGTIVQIGILF